MYLHVCVYLSYKHTDKLRIHIHFNKNGNIEINENERISVFMYVLQGNTQPTTIYRSFKPIYFFSCVSFLLSSPFHCQNRKNVQNNEQEHFVILQVSIYLLSRACPYFEFIVLELHNILASE